jgi:GTPase SAR1 family protein
VILGGCVLFYVQAKQLGGQDLEAVLVGNKCDLSGKHQTSFAGWNGHLTA